MPSDPQPLWNEHPDAAWLPPEPSRKIIWCDHTMAQHYGPLTFSPDFCTNACIRAVDLWGKPVRVGITSDDTSETRLLQTDEAWYVLFDGKPWTCTFHFEGPTTIQLYIFLSMAWHTSKILSSSYPAHPEFSTSATTCYVLEGKPADSEPA